MALAGLWARRTRTAIAAVIVAAAAIPGYLIGYHSGNIALIGLATTSGIGAMTVVYLIRRAVDKDEPGLDYSWPRLVCGIGTATGLLVLAMFVLMTELIGSINGMPDEVVTVVSNSQSSLWKPVAHLAMGSVILFAAAPVMLLVIPLMIRHGMGFKDALNVATWRVEGKHYNWLSTTMFLIVLTTVAWLPYVCLVVPAFVASLSEVMYRDIFSSKA
jgi:hypothetical protein